MKYGDILQDLVVVMNNILNVGSVVNGVLQSHLD